MRWKALLTALGKRPLNTAESRTYAVLVPFTFCTTLAIPRYEEKVTTN
jgi:hypothetical protein